MKKYLVTLILIINIIFALDWVNTGDLVRAKYVFGLIQGFNGYLYAGAVIDTTSADSGWVYYSSDYLNWQRCINLPGDQSGVYHLINGIGDTLFAGSSYWTGSNWEPRVYKSGDGGQNWTMLGSIPTPISGTQVWALLEGRNGNLYAGINWLSIHSSATPVYSTDRGQTWLNSINSCPYSPTSEFCLIEASDGNLYVGTWAGQRRLVYKSTNQSQNWIETDTMFDSGQARALIEGPPGTLFAGTYPKTIPQQPIGRVFKSTNGGSWWQQIGYGYFTNTSGIRSLYFTSDGRLFAGTVPQGEVFVSQDTGNTWTSTGVLPGANSVYRFLEVQVGESTYLYAATGPNGDVFRASIEPQVGIAKKSKIYQQPITIYPNPTTDILTITLPQNREQKINLTIYNACGQKLKELVLKKNPQSYVRLSLKNQGIDKGLYFLKLSIGKQSVVKRFLMLY